MFDIEKNIPIIKKLKRRVSKYPFPVMEVGDSFFVEVDVAHLAARANSVLGASKHPALLPRKFHVAIVETGIRCWRIK